MGRRHFITKILDFGAGLYDPLFRLTVEEERLREKLIELAHLKGEEKVLDIGCGTGTFDSMVYQSLEEGSICAVDISDKMVKTAKRKAERNGLGIDYGMASSTDLPYESSEFDVVFTSLIFHHLDWNEKRRTLQEIHRVLKPRGKYISVEFGEFPRDSLHRAFIKFTGNSGMLHGLYPPGLIEKAGFSILAQMEGPRLARHHQTDYRVLKKTVTSAAQNSHVREKEALKA